MFNKKIMKKVKLNKVGKYLANGETVFMVNEDETLEEVTIANLENMFFHSIKGGVFAVYKNHFNKTLKLGRWELSLKHEQKGGDNENEQQG